MEIYDNFKNYICLTVKMVFQVYLPLLDFALDNLNFLHPIKIKNQMNFFSMKKYQTFLK